MMETLKVLIVDDEYHARKLLSEYISKLPFLEQTGSVSNAIEAMNILQTQKIDILLMDIQMPEITGLELIRSLKKKPLVIFTTAYSEYAVESYELDVVDYLLKPIAFTRFLQAINKAIELSGINIPDKYLMTKKELPEKVDEDSIVLKSGSRWYKINYIDLLSIEGQREYVTFYTLKQSVTVLFSLKELEEKLPSELFIRIHKSHIVSIRNIEFIDKNILHIAGKKLPIGSSYKDKLMKLFG